MSGNTTTNQLVFKPCGRLGNAIFRYMSCAVVNLVNPELNYTLFEDFRPPSQSIRYYPGVDHVGDDVYKTTNIDNAIRIQEALQNHTIVGYNSLGFFKHFIDIEQLKSNTYINQYNGQGIFVKTSILLWDGNFFNMFYKKFKYFNVIMSGYSQFGYIYLKYKPQILKYIEDHKNTHYIQSDTNERFLMRDIIDDLVLPPEKQYDIAIHMRLDDFNGRIDFIELDYYLRLFESMLEVFEGRKICIVYQPSERPEDKKFMADCVAWFETHQIPLHVETNSLMVDFNIMKQVKILVCGMSTLAWTAAYLSKYLEKCYMPNYNFYKTNRPMCYFHKPIANTILYQVNSTPSVLGQVKTRLMTLPNYPARLGKLDDLIQKLAIIGLEPTIYHGVHGKDIDIHEAACQQTHIKHISWENTTYFYDMRVRINGQHMSRGEFGCAWSHLNLLRQLVADTDPLTNYYLVLEDDVELVKPLSDLYELIEHLPPDTDLCHLAKSDWYPFVLTNQVNTYFYECEKKYFNKTTAYIVSKKGAQKILDYTKNSINVPIDDLFNMIFRLTPDFRFYVPAAFYFKEQDNVVSTIKDIDHS